MISQCTWWFCPLTFDKGQSIENFFVSSLKDCSVAYLVVDWIVEEISETCEKKCTNKRHLRAAKSCIYKRSSTYGRASKFLPLWQWHVRGIKETIRGFLQVSAQRKSLFSS